MSKLISVLCEHCGKEMFYAEPVLEMRKVLGVDEAGTLHVESGVTSTEWDEEAERKLVCIDPACEFSQELDEEREVHFVQSGNR